MTKRFMLIWRKATLLMTAGVLLQAGGCGDSTILFDLLAASLSSLVQSVIFGSFNLV